VNILAVDDGAGERKKERKTYYNKLLKGKSYIIKSFSFPDTPEVKDLLGQVDKIAKLDGWTKSEAHLRALDLLVQKYGEGNPQLKLPSYLPNVENSPMRVLCSFCQGALKDGHVFCQKVGGMWIPGIRCYSCPKNRLRKDKSK
jgi:hypothetical protein